jgi:hypothetical protein
MKVDWALELGLDVEVLQEERPLAPDQLRLAREHVRRAESLWVQARGRADLERLSVKHGTLELLATNRKGTP